MEEAPWERPYFLGEDSRITRFEHIFQFFIGYLPLGWKSKQYNLKHPRLYFLFISTTALFCSNMNSFRNISMCWVCYQISARFKPVSNPIICDCRPPPINQLRLEHNGDFKIWSCGPFEWSAHSQRRHQLKLLLIKLWAAGEKWSEVPTFFMVPQSAHPTVSPLEMRGLTGTTLPTLKIASHSPRLRLPTLIQPLLQRNKISPTDSNSGRLAKHIKVIATAD